MSVATDYYAVLGVSRDANADEIRTAYRRLARELHPDVNPDPVNQERFKEITRAHEVLCDPDKRQMYDLGDDPFAPIRADGYFSRSRWEASRKDGYPRGRREPQRERWPPHPSGRPYSAYPGGSPPSATYDWRQPQKAKTHRPRPVFEAAALICVVIAFAALLVIHRSNNSGPLGRRFQSGSECLVLAGHQVVTYGREWLRNPGTAPAVIDQMTLADPEGLRLLAAWVVPTSGLLYGARAGYPPGKMLLPGWQWTGREPALGAEVPPTQGTNERVNLVFVLGLQPGDRIGQAAGIDIWYHVGGSQYHLRTAKSLDVQVGDAGTC